MNDAFILKNSKEKELLGVVINSNLNLNSHIKSAKKRALKKLSALSKISRLGGCL